MYIADRFAAEKQLISFEIFPPKKESGFEEIRSTVKELGTLAPAFISVTCGAGGSGSVSKTGEVAEMVRASGAEPLAHLTCVGARREAIRDTLAELRSRGVENILALRGDFPRDMPDALPGDYRYAYELIEEARAFGGLCVGAAAYPEGHVTCDDENANIEHLKRKREAGADFFITQLFFDNDYFYRFLERARGAGISLPITPGVMPIMNRAQIERMIFMAGASLPSPIIKLLHRYEDSPSDLRKAGVEHALRQMEELLRNGADGVHVYTMNKAYIGKKAMARLRK